MKAFCVFLATVLCWATAARADDQSASPEFISFSGGPSAAADAKLPPGQEPIACQSGACSEVCCDPGCYSLWKVHGDFLLLRATGEKVNYATPMNGAVVPPNLIGPVQLGTDAVVDNGFDGGFRVGASRALDPCSSIGFTYTWYESDAFDNIHVTGPVPLLRSLVVHQGLADATTQYLVASANDNIRFQLADIDFRRIFLSGCNYDLNYVLGVRYGNLHQDFHSRFTNVDRTTFVDTSTDFDGFGLRLGLEGERRGERGFLVYGKGYGSMLGGIWRGRYAQADTLLGARTNGGWDEDRLVSILEAEVGVGWTNPCGNFRLTAGYMVDAWFNTITTRDFISAIQANTAAKSSADLVGMTAFDGFVFRAELAY